ncbi:MAG TPA: hypothetical protein VE135_09510 [Pyrinomonadaceae bacterium]|nr:hypothetical protein [Pyrinomonadaceae bacterium]
MNCQKTESVINDLVREQMMETGVRDAALSHCETCSSCAKVFAEQRALTLALWDLARDSELIQAPQLVEHNLVAALRDRAAMTEAAPSRSRWTYWSSAVAATLLIVFSAAAVRLYQKRPVENAGRNSERPAGDNTKSQAPSVSTQTIAKQSTPPSRPNRNQRPRSLRPSSRPASSSAQQPATSTAADYASEIATEFLPLGYGNALNLQDGGQIVRVEVPRSALATFGLPMNMNRVGERVKADVLFGVDGSARAIRFVQ